MLAIPTLVQSTSIYLSFHSRQALLSVTGTLWQQRGKTDAEHRLWYLNSSKRPVLPF